MSSNMRVMRVASRVAAAGVLGGAGGGYWYLQHQHQQGSVPPGTVYRYDTRQNAVPGREEMMKKLRTETFDLVIIGGGATGSGVALDAASRGLRCALIEADDFGSGTSSRSTKLIHGGVRYLEQAFKGLDVGQFLLVWEALEERAHMMKAAPYLTHPLPIVMPIYKMWQVPYFWAGIKAYDWLARIVTCFDTGVPDCFYISRPNSLFFFPLLKDEKLKGSLVYYDGQQNDSRVNLHLALTSAVPNYLGDNDIFEPSAIVNHCTVQGMLKDESTEQLVGVKARDELTGDMFDVRGAAVVNCTGPFADQIRVMADPNCRRLVSPAAGVHVVLPSSYSPPNFGMIVPETSDGRVLFYLPWEGNTLAGTTDAESTLTHLPRPTTAEVDFIVKESARYLSLPEDLIRSDIRAAWSGLRPLVVDPEASSKSGTAQISRSHVLVVDPSGLVSVMGGKWTTYRRMAQEAVDKVLEHHNLKVQAKGACRSKNLQLLGCASPGKYKAEDVRSLGGQLPLLLSRDYKVPIKMAEHLAHNYGFRAVDICRLLKEQPALSKPLVEGHPFIKAEVVFAARHEMACTVTDVIARRLRLAFVDAEAALKAVPEVVSLMSSELKWSSSQTRSMEREVKEFLDTMKYSKPVPIDELPADVKVASIQA